MSQEFYEEQCRRLFKTYDVDQSGVLSIDQLTKLLTDRDHTTPEGTLPTQDEIQYVLWFADLNNDSCIDQKELELALKAWEAYLQERKRMQAKLLAFDESGSGSLTLEELQAYLTHINLGHLVEHEEAEAIFRLADIIRDGVIHTAELALATHIWKTSRRQKEGKSQMCSVM